MPFVQIHLMKGKSANYIKAIQEGVRQAIAAAWENPKDPSKRLGKYFTIAEYGPGKFYFDKDHLNVNRSKNIVYICINTSKYSTPMKKKLFRELVKILGKKPGIRRDDIFVRILELGPANWYSGTPL